MLEYLVNIRYHVAADPATVMGSLQQKLDDVSIKLLSEMQYIYWDENPVKIRDARTEKIDGVLHYFCNVRVLATKKQAQDLMQRSIDINIKLD